MPIDEVYISELFFAKKNSKLKSLITKSNICFKRSVWELEKYKLKNLNLNVMHVLKEKSLLFECSTYL